MQICSRGTIEVIHDFSSMNDDDGLHKKFNCVNIILKFHSSNMAYNYSQVKGVGFSIIKLLKRVLLKFDLLINVRQNTSQSMHPYFFLLEKQQQHQEELKRGMIVNALFKVG